MRIHAYAFIFKKINENLSGIQRELYSVLKYNGMQLLITMFFKRKW
jgi:hypothetical protein